LSGGSFHETDIFFGSGELMLAARAEEKMFLEFRAVLFGKASERIFLQNIFGGVSVENQAILHRMPSHTGILFLSGKRPPKFSGKMHSMPDDSVFSCRVLRNEPWHGS
jgi:hypothetical protein